MTHKVAQGGELERFRLAESNRNNVMVFPGVNKPARIQEIGRVGIQQSGGTNSALISAVQMLARSSPMAVYRLGDDQHTGRSGSALGKVPSWVQDERHIFCENYVGFLCQARVVLNPSWN